MDILQYDENKGWVPVFDDMDYCRTQIEAAVIIRIEEMSVVIIYLSTNYSLWSEQLGVDIINSSDIWKEKNPRLATA